MSYIAKYELLRFWIDQMLSENYEDIMLDLEDKLDVFIAFAVRKYYTKSDHIVDVWIAFNESNNTPRFAGKKLRAQVLERDNYTCTMCGATNANVIDHVYPYSLGGKTVINNLTTLCQSCNSKKGNRI